MTDLEDGFAFSQAAKRRFCTHHPMPIYSLYVEPVKTGCCWKRIVKHYGST